ncbi:MAG: IS30 family transposase [Thermomicrobiales bacterium]|nr:IS30 family transposase [Thermomicrobiales bacterium]
MSQSAAAVRIGINVRTARDWDQGIRHVGNARIYPDGRRVDYATGRTSTVPVPHASPSLMALEQAIHPRYLSLQEREQIADLHRDGQSLRAIGRAMGRSSSTIKRELDRNTSESGTYQPHAAHRQAVARRPRPKPAKLAHEGPLRTYLLERLADHWSPEQISRMLPVVFPENQEMRVSTETIYQSIYVQTRGGLRRELTAALRSGRTRRVSHRHAEQRTPRFSEPMLMISERPAEVEDRAVPGHWEGDLILGASSRSAIVTLVERSTRYVMLGYLPGGHTAEEVHDVLVEVISTLPEHLRHSLTWDQGAEMAQHRRFTLATNMPVYFCDPSSPWQRGSNENTNGLLRQYFPKGTDLSVHGPEELARVAAQLNSRPRKTLNWSTPAQRLRDLISAVP